MKDGVICECTYCGYKWLPKISQYGYMLVGNPDSCPKCGDKDLIKKSYEKVDYYTDTKKNTSKT